MITLSRIKTMSDSEFQEVIDDLKILAYDINEFKRNIDPLSGRHADASNRKTFEDFYWLIEQLDMVRVISKPARDMIDNEAESTKMPINVPKETLIRFKGYRLADQVPFIAINVPMTDHEVSQNTLDLACFIGTERVSQEMNQIRWAVPTQVGSSWRACNYGDWLVQTSGVVIAISDASFKAHYQVSPVNPGGINYV